MTVALVTAFSSVLVVLASRSRPMAWKPIPSVGIVMAGVVTVVVPEASTRVATVPSGVVVSTPRKATMRPVVWFPASATVTEPAAYQRQNKAQRTPPAAAAVPVPIWLSSVQPDGVAMVWLADSTARRRRSPVVAVAGRATVRATVLDANAPAPTYSTATGHLLSIRRRRYPHLPFLLAHGHGTMDHPYTPGSHTLFGTVLIQVFPR